MPADHKSKLVEFITKKAFEPVMRAKLDDKSDADCRALKRVQETTESEIERCREYRSVAEVSTNFNRDLHSTVAKKAHAQLRRLHLPTIEDIAGEVDAKLHELGIGASN